MPLNAALLDTNTRSTFKSLAADQLRDTPVCKWQSSYGHEAQAAAANSTTWNDMRVACMLLPSYVSEVLTVGSGCRWRLKCI